MRYYLASILLFIFASLASCEKDETPSNVDPIVAIGFDSFVLEMPVLERYETACEYEYVEVKLMGEDDMVEYTLTMDTYGSDYETLHLEATCEIMESMPHQRYFLNRIILPNQSSRSGEAEEISVGAILSAADPTQIAFVSSFDTRTDSVGSGTYGDPYTVVSVEDLIFLSESMIKGSGDSYKGKFVKQTGYIDGTLDYSLDGTGYWAPLGTGASSVSLETADGVAFCGTYDGSGFYISNLNSDNLYNIGFFMALGDGALIKNLQLLSLSFSGATNVGGLASWVEDGAAVTIEDYFVGGYVNGKENVGGFIGSGGARFIGCSSNVSIANNWDATSDDSSFSEKLGGFIGCATGESKFQYCNFTGSISQANTHRCGGFIGSSEGSDSKIDISFKNCGVTGLVGGLKTVGGVIGNVYYSTVTFEDVVIGGSYIRDQLIGEYTILYGGASIILALESLRSTIYNYIGSYNSTMYVCNEPDGDAYCGGFFGGCYGSDITFNAGCEVSSYTYIPMVYYTSLYAFGTVSFFLYLGALGGGICSDEAPNSSGRIYSTVTSNNNVVNIGVNFGSYKDSTDIKSNGSNFYISGTFSVCIDEYVSKLSMIENFSACFTEDANLAIANAQFLTTGISEDYYKSITIKNNSKYKKSDVPILGTSTNMTNITYSE